jgi:hypothetical protein
LRNLLKPNNNCVDLAGSGASETQERDTKCVSALLSIRVVDILAHAVARISPLRRYLELRYDSRQSIRTLPKKAIAT